MSIVLCKACGQWHDDSIRPCPAKGSFRSLQRRMEATQPPKKTSEADVARAHGMTVKQFRELLERHRKFREKRAKYMRKYRKKVKDGG